MSGLINSVRVLSRMVKIEHSIFALPFAFSGSFLAAMGWPGWKTLVLVTIAMVSIRSFAMAVNRLADLKFDRENPRTQDRPLVSGEITPLATFIFIVVTAIIFVFACAGMNTLVLYLSPIALFLSAGYSYTKRFTVLCHYWLGSVLGLAPIAGWLAYDPTFHMAPVLLGIGVTFWVAGFDILYACQDVDFDKKAKLHSMPAALGIPTALALSTFSHVNTSIFFLLVGWAANLGWWYFGTAIAIAIILIWEHRLVRPNDLRRVNMAFFTLNGVIAVMTFAGILADIFF